MTKIIHIIGLQGTGKSTLADAICKSKVAAGHSCMNLTEEGMHEPGQAINVAEMRMTVTRTPFSYALKRSNFLIAEHLSNETLNDLQPGDTVIHIQRIEANLPHGL